MHKIKALAGKLDVPGSLNISYIILFDSRILRLQTEAGDQTSIYPKCTCASVKEPWLRSSFICDLKEYEKQCLGAICFEDMVSADLDTKKVLSILARHREQHLHAAWQENFCVAWGMLCTDTQLWLDRFFSL